MKGLDMSMFATLAMDLGWYVQENVVQDNITLVVEGPNACYMATGQRCQMVIPPAMIDAIRAMKPKQIPHLRAKRAEALTNRSKHGWVTRRKKGGAV